MTPYRINWKTKPTKQSGVVALQMRVRWYNSACECVFALGVPVEESKYNKDTCRVKINTTHTEKKIPALLINKRIEAYEDYVDKIFQTNDNIDVEYLKREFNQMSGKVCARKKTEDPNRILSLYNKFVEETRRANNWSSATETKANTVKRHMFAYNSDKVTIDKIDEKFMYNILRYLSEHEKLKNSYIDRVFMFIKMFLKWLECSGYKLPPEVRHFNPKLRGAKELTKQLIYLTQDELKAVCDYQCETADMGYTKDCFLFCCFTGLRYSDMASLRKSDIYDDKIHIVTQKTTDALVIELNDKSRAILEKYKDIVLPRDLALPVVSNQTMNYNLHRLMEKVGITTPIKIVSYSGTQRNEEVKPKNKLIGTHTGRHTFIVSALTLGIPAEVIMRWTGHKDYDAMKPYVAIVDKLKEDEMKKFNGMFS